MWWWVSRQILRWLHIPSKFHFSVRTLFAAWSRVFIQIVTPPVLALRLRKLTLQEFPVFYCVFQSFRVPSLPQRAVHQPCFLSPSPFSQFPRHLNPQNKQSFELPISQLHTKADNPESQDSLQWLLLRNHGSKSEELLPGTMRGTCLATEALISNFALKVLHIKIMRELFA